MAIVLSCPQCSQQSSVGEEHAGKVSVCPFCNTRLVIPNASGPATFGGQQPRAVREKKSAGLGVIIAIVVAAAFIPCTGVMVGLMLPAVQAAREAARRTQCMNNERQLDLACQNYASAFTHFPPAVKSDNARHVPHSWRVDLLPFLEDVSLYKAYDQSKPWNDPANEAVLNAMPKVFQCPSEADMAPNETSYFMLTGPGTVGGIPGSSGASMAEIRNGLRQTILIVEVPGMHVPWTKPQDITVAEFLSRWKRDAPNSHPGGFNIAFCDGSVSFTRIDEIDLNTLQKMTSTGSVQPVGGNQPFGGNRPFGGNHPNRNNQPPGRNQPAPDVDDPLEAK